MLDTPKHGWSKIHIGAWSDRCSYLDDVPMKLLEAFFRCFRCHEPQSVRFDAEGYEYIIVFDIYQTYVITSDDEDRLTVLDTTYRKLAPECIADIRRDLDAWVNFLVCDYEGLGTQQKRKDEICRLCDMIESRIAYEKEQHHVC